MLMSVATLANDQHVPVLLDVKQVKHVQCVSRLLNSLSGGRRFSVNMEDTIAKLLNSSSSQKEKLHDLLNDHLDKIDEAEDSHSDSDDDSSTDNIAPLSRFINEFGAI